MIARLRAAVQPGVSSALLLRDAARASRRWQTYGVRAAFSAALMGIVLATIFGVTEMVEVFDAGNLASLGRGMFVAFAVVQVVLVSIIAPFGVARAVIEEREQNTMELLMLTRLSARQVLVAKVFARILLLLTVILGALPVLGLVISLGGVSVIEVITVTAHAVTTVVVLGVLGGFFGIFTRSPIVATLAALFYGFCAFGVMPLLYIMITGDYESMAHFSPLYGTLAKDWWSVLPVFSYMPVIAMVFLIGARLFELRVANARLRHFFSAEAWSGTAMKWSFVAVVIAMVCVLPIAIGVNWTFSIAALSGGAGSSSPWAHPLAWLVEGTSRAVSWGWSLAVLVLCTWLYMRIGMDIVMMVDDMLHPGKGRTNDTKRRQVYVWGNPVAWRELRTKTWKIMGPTIGIWLLCLMSVFQMGVWAIPGGLLVMGAVNAVAALILTIWLATGTIERERRDGTLEILLTSTLSSLSILFGKVLGVALPSGTLMLITLPMLLLGVPYLQVFFLDNGGSGMGLATLKAMAAFIWVGALWCAVLVGSMTTTLALRNPRAAYGVTTTVLALLLIVPPAIAGLARDYWLVALPARLLVPVLVARPTLWEMGLSTAAYSAVALVAFIVCAVKLRAWGLRDDS